MVWLDVYYANVSKEQIDFYLNDPYYKALVQKVVNASSLSNGLARNHRVNAIDIYNEINGFLGIENDKPENTTYILTDSVSKNYIGKYKLIE